MNKSPPCRKRSASSRNAPSNTSCTVAPSAPRRNQMQELRGKVAFITGGASGIGLGMAGAFVESGMKVVLADLRQDHIDEALAQLAQRGHSGDVHAIRMDVTDRVAMAAAADEAERVFGK